MISKNKHQKCPQTHNFINKGKNITFEKHEGYGPKSTSRGITNGFKYPKNYNQKRSLTRTNYN
jgi:hypothetical protein